MNIIHLQSANEQKVIKEAVFVLRRGGLLIYPTETVYGLGVDATNQKAVNTLFKFKGQRGLKPILIAVSDQNMAEKYVEINDVARNVYKKFLPGPVAVVSRTLTRLADGIASPENTVGIRIPDYPLILKIIRAFGKPMTSTSANISGARNPWAIDDVKETTPKERFELIDLILDAGKLPKRPPSTVVDTSKEKTEIVREGEVRIAKTLNTEYRIPNEKYISQSETDTKHIAERLLQELFSYSTFSMKDSPLIFALQGPLGVGKTIFAKGVGRALGITDPIRSPSYTLVHEYSIPLALRPYPLSLLFHIDAWRLHSTEEFEDLGLDRLLKSKNIIVIEWIERLQPIIEKLQKKARIVSVKIGVVDEKRREIKIKCLFLP